MKKKLMAILLIVFALLLTTCKADKQPQTEQPADDKTAVETPDVPEDTTDAPETPDAAEKQQETMEEPEMEYEAPEGAPVPPPAIRG